MCKVLTIFEVGPSKSHSWPKAGRAHAQARSIPNQQLKASMVQRGATAKGGPEERKWCEGAEKKRYP